MQAYFVNHCLWRLGITVCDVGVIWSVASWFVAVKVLLYVTGSLLQKNDTNSPMATWLAERLSIR